MSTISIDNATHHASTSIIETKEDALDEIAMQLRANVHIKDRKYHLQTYPKCFVGREAVDVIMNLHLASTRDEAVVLGQSIMTELGLFEHVTRDHPFEDAYLFYHFVDRGNVAINPASGERFNWGDYLAPTDLLSNKSRSRTLQPELPLPDFHTVPPNDVHVASTVWPLDEHNTQLLNHVHPTGWQSPNPQDKKYDLVVIGAGAAGLVTSAGAAGVGAKVALIEANLLGGDCLNVGCVPSKTLIHAAQLAHTAKKMSASSGISIKGGVDVDFPKVMERVRKVRADISHHDSAERFSKELGVEVHLGYAKFVDKESVIVNGEVLRFNKAVIATGGYPSLVPMPGLKELYHLNTNPGDDSMRPYVMTNETFFNMTKQPKNLLVIGPGVIGLELAQSMQRLGTQVTVFGRSGRVLPKEDEDHAQIIQSQLESEGVVFRLSVSEYISVSLTGLTLDNGLPQMSFKVEELREGKQYFRSEVLADAILVATGRRPNVTGMDLEAAGVEFDTKLGVRVNDNLRTTNSKIFAAGDCCSTFKFTHAADFMARTVIRNSLFLGRDKVSNLLIPYATFTDPEVASVGLYGKDCDSMGIKYRTFEKRFEDNDRSICDDTTAGMVRIRVEEQSDKILGATIVGKGAANMISEITLAMQTGTGLGSLAAVIHPYPTNAEAIRQTGDLYSKTRLTQPVKAILRGLIKVQR